MRLFGPFKLMFSCLRQAGDEETVRGQPPARRPRRHESETGLLGPVWDLKTFPCSPGMSAQSPLMGFYDPPPSQPRRCVSTPSTSTSSTPRSQRYTPRDTPQTQDTRTFAYNNTLSPTRQQQQHLPHRAALPRTAPSPQLTHLLTTLHTTLSHTKYALTGRAALATHGFPFPSPCAPQHVTLICLRADRLVLRAWACTAGWEAGNGSQTGEVLVPVGTRTWRVRLKGVDETEWVRTGVEMMFGGRVVGLVGLLDLFARSWVLSHYHDREEGGEKEREREVAAVVIWILERIVEKGQRIKREEVPNVVGEAFWGGLTGRLPRVGGLLARAGLAGPDGWV